VKVLVDTPAGIKELRLWDESGTFRVVFHREV
jgi:phage-related protein